ncbi:MAG TPA: SprT family zinc-dependent metalloprotease [Coriobacteriia bacterium]|nr:SprT family zinc-dependent metalloprotease [Coriobacteriia bacterium]
MTGRYSAGGGLPEYSVRTSARARRVRLSVTPRHGLVVTVPERFSGDVPSLVASKREWAERALAHVAEKRALLLAGPEALLPHQVELRSLGIVLPVEYRATASPTVSARASAGGVLVSGDIDDAEKCLEALRRWLARTAKAELPRRCTELASEHGIQPRTIAVSSARTRWGSCSARGKVMLNRNLIFLPPELVDALILHELAHLRVLDHSPRFWSLLATLDPQVLEHRARLKKASDLVPVWADG